MSCTMEFVDCALYDRDSIPGRGRDFSPRHRFQTGSEAHPASHPVGSGDSFTGGKAGGS
jgi:hypothetical protein